MQQSLVNPGVLWGCPHLACSRHSINNCFIGKCPRDHILGLKAEQIGGINEICPNHLFADGPVWKLESESKDNA